jgi:hypothetical protein
MYFDKEYCFPGWAGWSLFVRDCMRDFHNEYGVYPEYLIANSYTFSQIDLAVRPGMEEVHGKDQSDLPIGSLQFLDKELVFGVEEEIEDRHFILLLTDELDDDDGSDDNDKPGPKHVRPIIQEKDQASIR